LIDVVRGADKQHAERARVRLLELLETLPPDDPRALRARRSLSLALY
jgi:thioredoxin-like negative regulator of GroEL